MAVVVRNLVREKIRRMVLGLRGNFASLNDGKLSTTMNLLGFRKQCQHIVFIVRDKCRPNTFASAERLSYRHYSADAQVLSLTVPSSANA